MFRFAIKAGIAGTAVYYLNKEGVWKDSQESLKVYDRLNTVLGPYVKEVSNQIPIELPETSISGRPSDTLSLYWNKGVIATFKFLSELPRDVVKWTNEGVSSVLSNSEIQNLLQATPSSPEKPTK